MPNKYVDFVSDEHFLECVRWVCNAYPKSGEKVNMEELEELGLDLFKMIFDINSRKINVNTWIEMERIRQSDKTISNKVGEFHQKILGGAKGWEDLGVGNQLGVDIKNNKNTIFIELKNKHNTVKGSDLKHIFDTLRNIANKYPKASVYYAYIIPKKPGSGERILSTSHRNENSRVKEIWGSKVYEIVTGDAKALEKTWKAIPLAIEEVLGQKGQLQKLDIDRLVKFFQKLFE